GNQIYIAAAGVSFINDRVSVSLGIHLYISCQNLAFLGINGRPIVDNDRRSGDKAAATNAPLRPLMPNFNATRSMPYLYACARPFNINFGSGYVFPVIELPNTFSG